MEERRYLIGEVSQITGISKDTLRFYDRINLVKPMYTDEGNNYRYYTYDQFWRLDIISCLRQMNVPIERIKEILATRSNEKVMELLKEQQKEVQEHRDFLQKVSDDIDWYMEQQRQIEQTVIGTTITVKEFPVRAVLYGDNAEDTHAYHLKVQELCRKAMKQSYSIRRNYGFVLDEAGLSQNCVKKKGEYIWFEGDEFEQIERRYLTILPAGKYACCTVKVVNEKADFSVLRSWLEERHIFVHHVHADEIGLQLFDYVENGYLCEIKVLIKEENFEKNW